MSVMYSVGQYQFGFSVFDDVELMLFLQDVLFDLELLSCYVDEGAGNRVLRGAFESDHVQGLPLRLVYPGSVYGEWFAMMVWGSCLMEALSLAISDRVNGCDMARVDVALIPAFRVESDELENESSDFLD